MCALTAGGGVRDATLSVSPAEAKPGSEVALQLSMEVTGALGVGMIRVALIRRDGGEKEIASTDIPGA